MQIQMCIVGIYIYTTICLTYIKSKKANKFYLGGRSLVSSFQIHHNSFAMSGRIPTGYLKMQSMSRENLPIDPSQVDG
jgi:hypothetical protein